MSTKVLNKLVNICTTLSGGEVSSGGTSNDSSCNALSSSEIIDLIYPVGSIYCLDSTTNPKEIFGICNKNQMLQYYLRKKSK